MAELNIPYSYLLSRLFPFHLGSATLGPGMEPNVRHNLHLRDDLTSVIRLNTDRPNIFLIVEKMKHPANSFEDLAFVIKKNVQMGDPIPPKFGFLQFMSGGTSWCRVFEGLIVS